jgi:hypothetical protein
MRAALFLCVAFLAGVQASYRVIVSVISTPKASVEAMAISRACKSNLGRRAVKATAVTAATAATADGAAPEENAPGMVLSDGKSSGAAAESGEKVFPSLLLVCARARTHPYAPLLSITHLLKKILSVFVQ